MEPSLDERLYQSAILTKSAAPLKYHNGTEPCDRFVRKGSGIGLGLHSWHGVWDGRSDLSLEGISEGWKDSIKLDGLPDDGLFFDAKVSF